MAPTIIMYTLGEEKAYVGLGETYEKAIDFAIQAFPGKLGTIDRKKITFHWSDKCITESAWVGLMANMKQYFAVTIRVGPPEEVQLPGYREVEKDKRSVEALVQLDGGVVRKTLSRIFHRRK